MSRLRLAVDSMVYLSAVFGLVLVYSAYGLVPAWLIYSLASGEAAYILAAVGVARRFRPAYYGVFFLAVLTLLASLPRPEHYAFATEGDWAQFLIFLVGSALQVGLIVTIPIMLRRHDAGQRTP